MRPANGFVRRATLAACATLLTAAMGAFGCATPTVPPTPPPRPARVELVNLSGCDWRVILATSAGRTERTVHLGARESTRVELAGGDYIITQTALTGIAQPESTRQFPAHFDAGETYRWRLVTLLSATTAATP